MSAVRTLKRIGRGLLKLGVLPVVFVAAAAVANLALASGLGLAEGVGFAAAGEVTYRQSAAASVLIAVVVTGWYAG